MNIRHAIAASVVALGAFGVSAASASTVLTENFDAADGFANTIVVGPGSGSPDSASSDRWANTSYYTINNVHGWTFSGTTPLFAEQTNALGIGTGNGALELNEYSGVGTTLLGLDVGQTYNLSFLLFGDNRPGSQYFLDVSVGGVSLASINGTDGAAGTNPGTLETYSFTATNASETLRFAQATVNPSQASPIIDNISVISAVPEPATWAMMLIGFGAVGFAMRGSLRKKAGAVTA